MLATQSLIQGPRWAASPGTLLKMQNLRTSPVVQQLRLHAPNAEDLGSIPGQGTRLHMQQLRPSAAINLKIFRKNCRISGPTLDLLNQNLNL